MPLVLVHGNPETAAIWDELIPHLNTDDIITLTPPGFGAPLPNNFDATSDGYLNWLINEIKNIEGPVDLIGHDWGGGHVVRLACERPELIRSWASDILGIFTPEYVWHENAQIWQTPGAGEEAVAERANTTDEAWVERFQSLGMTKSIAEQIATWVNIDMGQCVLSLYRSAAQPALGNMFKGLARAAEKPGLALIATDDPYVGGMVGSHGMLEMRTFYEYTAEILGRKAAEQAQAQVGIIDGEGHWWMCTNPEKGAHIINNFLNSL